MDEYIVVSRDCESIQIPEGIRVILRKGTPVRIVQALGGAFTVTTEFGQMLRVDSENVDAIGQEVLAPEPEADDAGTLEERAWSRMRSCYDPEIPVNVVELGLIYDCTLTPVEDGRHQARIKMTLTAPGCGMGQILAEDIKRTLESMEEIAWVDIELVFDPPWNPNMMSEAARLQLGFL